MDVKTNPDRDLISLAAIKNQFLVFFCFLYSGIRFVFDAIWNSKALFLFLVLLGSITGYLAYTFSTRYFKGEMILLRTELSRGAYLAVISNLNKLISDGTTSQVANALSMPADKAALLLSLEGEDIGLRPDDSTYFPFKVTARFADTSIRQAVENGIINHMNSLPYLSKIKAEERKIKQQRLEFLHTKQEAVDSIINNLIHNGSSLASNSEGLRELLKNSQQLQTEKEWVNRWLSMYGQDVQLWDGFKIPARPIERSLARSILEGLASGALLGVTVCTILSLYKIVKQHT